MSQITKALKKVQAGREFSFEQISGGDQDRFKSFFMVIPILGIIVAVVASFAAMTKIEFNKNDILDLEHSLESQQRKIDQLTMLFENSKKSSDMQIKQLNARLDQAVRDFKIKTYSLGVSGNEHYHQLEASIGENKQEISALTKDLTNIRRKMEEISINNQIKDVKNP